MVILDTGDINVFLCLCDIYYSITVRTVLLQMSIKKRMTFFFNNKMFLENKFTCWFLYENKIWCNSMGENNRRI